MLINPDEATQVLRDEVTQKEGLGIKVDYIAALQRLTALQSLRDDWYKYLRAAGGTACVGIEKGFHVELNGGLTIQLVKPMPDWKKYMGSFNNNEETTCQI